MNNKFDELTKAMAQSVTRRAALKKFGVGLAGMVLACFGLANRAQAGTSQCNCITNADCPSGRVCSSGTCTPNWCDPAINPCCCKSRKTHLPGCSPSYPACTQNCKIAFP
jgi:Cys-rich repeat protein